MIVLDTNVISEALRPGCNLAVRSWLNARAETELFTTSITFAKLLSGVAIMTPGHRKQELSRALDEFVAPLFSGRCLAFDVAAAKQYAEILASMRERGRAIGPLDCQIAAIAAASRKKIATRDARPFAEAGLEVINPWTDE